MNFGYVQTSTGTGRIFIDANDNGIADAGESLGINGSTVTLTATSATGGLMVLSSTAVTNGRWSFHRHACHNHQHDSIRLPPNRSYQQRGHSAGRLNADAGLRLLLVRQSWRFCVYRFQSNGIRDGGETSGFSGATITVTGTTASGGALTAVQRTTSTGRFSLPASAKQYQLYACTHCTCELRYYHRFKF